MPIYGEPECRASISGNCLQLTHGSGWCREGECIDGKLNDMARKARERAQELARAPVRHTRKPVRGSGSGSSKPSPPPADPQHSSIPDGSDTSG